MSKLIGYRTVIVNFILVVVGAFRVKHPGALPDDNTIESLVNAVLDAVFSVPGAGVINLILRLLTTTPIFKK